MRVKVDFGSVIVHDGHVLRCYRTGIKFQLFRDGDYNRWNSSFYTPNMYIDADTLIEYPSAQDIPPPENQMRVINK